MTDNEIIKALECCSNYNDCDKCNFEPKDNKKKTIGCCLEIMKESIAIINRQQAEIDRLKINLKAVLDEKADHTEAIKEFAERLKGKKQVVFTAVNDSSYAVTVENINNLVKEMVGE